MLSYVGILVLCIKLIFYPTFYFFLSNLFFILLYLSVILFILCIHRFKIKYTANYIVCYSFYTM